MLGAVGVHVADGQLVAGVVPAIRVVSASDEATVCPLTEVITSPLVRPPAWAGVPGYTWQMSAPELTGGV